MNFNKHIVKEKLNIYGGSERKKTVILDNGKQYMLKFPDPIREAGRSISYINNAISEYIGCHIFQSIGLNVQNTILGVYTTDSGKEIIACACEDFAVNGKVLHEAKKLELGSLESAIQKNITFNNQNKLFEHISDISSAELKEFYYDLFIADALIGNYDRHNGNWGLISDADTISIAPIYDCGSSLEPLLSDEDISINDVTKYALNANSSIYYNSKRLKYIDVFNNTTNNDIIEAGKRIIPKINLQSIRDIINNTPFISDNRKNFYYKLIDIRYEKILLPFFDRLTSVNISHNCIDDKKDYYQLYKNDFIGLKNISWEKTLYVLQDYNLYIQKAGKNHVICYDSENNLLGTLSTRSNNNDIRKNICKLESWNYDIEIPDKIKEPVVSESDIEEDIEL